MIASSSEIKEKKKELKAVKAEFRHVCKKLDKLVSDHNNFFNNYTEENINEWFESMPLSNLRDFLDYEYGHLSADKLCLPQLKEKYKLRKKHEQCLDRLEILHRKRTVLEIELLQDKILKLNNDKL